jgi:cold shock protein
MRSFLIRHRFDLSDIEIRLRSGCTDSMHESAIRYEKVKMAQGTVKWFNEQKGFGFIQPDEGGPDVFVHISAVDAAGMRGLKEGQKIAYDITEERGKKAATNLKAAA